MIREKLKHNLKIKLLSVLFAFLTWVFVMAEVDPIVTRTIDNVQVNSITNQAEIDELGLVISPDSNLNIRVGVKGRRSLVNAYVDKEPVVIGTIKNPSLGVNQIELAVQSRDNVELTVNPTNTEVILEEIVSVRINISTRVMGEVAEGYEVSDVKLNPDSTLVEGPDSLISQVSEVIANIDVTNANKDFIQNVKFRAIDIKGNEVSDVRLQIRYVEATVTINKKKVVPVELVVTDGNEELELKNYYIDPKEIQIQGTESAVKQIDSIKTKPITIEQLRDAGELMVNLDLPAEINSNIVSGKLKINSEPGYTMNLNFDKDQVIINGYDSDITNNIYSILPESIKVSVTYDESFEGKVSEEDIRVYVDTEKSSVESNRFYFAVESELPYLRVVISPNVINKIN